MSSPFVIINTADLEWRNDLPYSLMFDDVYFSKQDGFAEKQLVFVEGNHLLERWRALHSGSQFTVGEIGFGTSLNFLLTWQNWLHCAPADATLYYYSCEKYPLKPDDLSKCLALWPQLQPLAQQFIDQYPLLTPGFHQLSFAQGRVRLILMLGEACACFEELVISGNKALDAQLHHHFIDAWYLDGFAPAKNATLWDEKLFTSISLLSHAQTTLATYSAAAPVKQGLQRCGFAVQKLPGFGNKRHRLTARFITDATLRYKAQTPWHRSVINKSNQRHSLVIGAGLAGCFTARSLAERGWQVTVLDSKEVAAGASGNEQAVLYPNLSAFASPLTQFMLSAFLYAQAYYRPLLGKVIDGELQGILQLAHNAKEATSQHAMTQWLAAYPALGKLVDCQEASTLAGIALAQSALWIPLAGWINSKQLCRHLLQHNNIDYQPHTLVSSIERHDERWFAANYHSENVVIANGYQAKQFKQTAYLPLKPLRGQISKVAAHEESLPLQLPLCGDGHILPTNHQHHQLGATYGLGIIDETLQLSDDLQNLTMVKKLSTALAFSEQALLPGWAAVRAATTDYLPVVGAIPITKDFNERFALLSTNTKRWINNPMPAYPGLYLCAGFGSRGLTTIPLSAHWLASLMNQEPACISNSMAKSLSPARFLYKKVIRSL